MRLNNVTLEEARHFLGNRTAEEQKYYRLDVEREIRMAEFITGTWCNGGTYRGRGSWTRLLGIPLLV